MFDCCTHCFDFGLFGFDLALWIAFLLDFALICDLVFGDLLLIVGFVDCLGGLCFVCWLMLTVCWFDGVVAFLIAFGLFWFR